MLFAFNVGAQSLSDSVVVSDVDSTFIIKDIKVDTSATQNDSVAPSRIRKVKVDLDNQVVFSSNDSIVMTGKNRIYMYGQGKVTYGKLKLDADQIDMDMKTSLVYAVGRKDSLGEWIG
jgi:lipopolysaccharide assembly outer membrane protein LptD (OstA)